MALAAARVSCLLLIAPRAGGYDPGVPGERVVWAALPPAWALALEDAASAARRPRPTARDAAEVLALASVSGATDAGQETG